MVKRLYITIFIGLIVITPNLTNGGSNFWFQGNHRENGNGGSNTENGPDEQTGHGYELRTFNSKGTKISKEGPTVSFGGKIYVAPIPGLTCIGLGTSTISSANVTGVAQAVEGINQTTKGQGGLGATNIVSGISSMIPVYTTDSTKVPRPLGQILGRKKLIPDFNTCKAGTIPIPVVKTTSNYNVSR